MNDEKKEKYWDEIRSKAEIAQLPEACCEKIQECEKELNKCGYWNIALVAYQMKD